ncbi:hypothetical protein [Phaeobacter sp. S60]|uniref:hypothetical protein n=1 Tax=Phaeobacter sp. S60 TaxID=1569353 RepID=UPI0015855407|nr:hypothetical protein [Phaeobacter sp. S60]
MRRAPGAEGVDAADFAALPPLVVLWLANPLWPEVAPVEVATTLASFGVVTWSGAGFSLVFTAADCAGRAGLRVALRRAGAGFATVSLADDGTAVLVPVLPVTP